MTEKEFTAGWIRKLSSGVLKSFPEDFLDSADTKVIKLPSIELILGEELFGNYDLLDTKHNSVLMVDDYYSAKYIIYANRTKPGDIRIPVINEQTTKMVKAYEKHLDETLRVIEKEFNKNFPGSKNHLSTINDIFNHVNIKRL